MNIDLTTNESKKNLIYTCSVGDERYKKLCVILVKSLRNLAKYTGDIILFVDKNEYFDELRDLCDIREVNFRKISVERDTIKYTKSHYYNRIVVGDFFDPSVYHNIAYFDNDCFIQKNIDSIFCSRGEFIYFEESLIMDKCLESNYVLKQFPEYENYKNTKTITSGIFVTHGNSFLRHMRTWGDSVIQYPDYNLGSENAYLSYVIRKKIIPDAVPCRCIEYSPARRTTDLKNENIHIFHFIGNILNVKKQSLMEECYNYNVLKCEYTKRCNTPSYINEHLPTLKYYASMCDSVVEFGVDEANSTFALMYGFPKKIISYDILDKPAAKVAKKIAGENGIEYEFKVSDSRYVDIDPCDLLFIDSDHKYAVCYIELTKHSAKVKKYIILHDTVYFGTKDTGEKFGHCDYAHFGKRGLNAAIDDFLKDEKDGINWIVEKIFINNNGLTILKRK